MKIQLQIDSKGSQEVLPNDVISENPTQWPEIFTTTLTQLLTGKGSHQVTNWNFPITESGRKFLVNYYYCQLLNRD